MFRPLSFSTAMVCGVFGCSSDPTATQPPTNLERALLATQSPDGPGAFVIRAEGTAAFLWVFEDPALTVLSGISLDQLAPLCAAGEVAAEPAREQVVFRPDGTSQTVTKAGDLSVLVFEGVFADFCAVAPIAVGEGAYSSTTSGSFGSRTASIVSRLVGRVIEKSDEPHHLLIKYHAQFDPATGEIRELTNEIEFN